MKNEKLVVDIGTFENIVIIKVIDIPNVDFSATEIERCSNDPSEDVTITLTTSTKDRNLTSMYSYSVDVGDYWRFLFPTVEYYENINHLEELKLAINYFTFLINIVDCIKFDDNYDINNYIYVGEEIPEPTVDDIERSKE